MRSRCAILTALVLGLMLVAAPPVLARQGEMERSLRREIARVYKMAVHGDNVTFTVRDGARESVNEMLARVRSERNLLAQAQDEDSETQGEGGGSGQSPEAEASPAEDAAGEAVAETGPPWTFQMARMALALSVLLGLAIARWYYKLVVSRQKGAA